MKNTKSFSRIFTQVRFMGLLASFLSFSVSIWAGDLSLEGVQELKIVGGNFKIEMFSVKSGSGMVQFPSSSDLNYSVDRNGSTLMIKSKAEDSSFGTFKIFTSEEKSMDFNGRDINAQVTGYVGSIKFKARELTAQLRMGKGNIYINAPKGKFSISNQQGDSEIETYSGSLQIKESTGQLEVLNFSGENMIEKQIGRLKLKQHSGGSKITGNEGSLIADIGRSSLSISEQKGRVEIDTKEGPVSLGFATEPEADVKSKSGKVVIQLNQGNVWLNLQTESGDLYGPSELKPFRVGAYKYIKGRTPGSGKGQVVVKTTEATVLIK